MVDVLVRAAPSKVRPVNERIQADEIYKAGALRVTQAIFIETPLVLTRLLDTYTATGIP